MNEQDLKHKLQEKLNANYNAWTLADTRNAEQNYELDEAFCEPGQDEGVRMC